MDFVNGNGLLLPVSLLTLQYFFYPPRKAREGRKKGVRGRRGILFFWLFQSECVCTRNIHTANFNLSPSPKPKPQTRQYTVYVHSRCQRGNFLAKEKNNDRLNDLRKCTKDLLHIIHFIACMTRWKYCLFFFNAFYFLLCIVQAKTFPNKTFDWPS